MTTVTRRGSGGRGVTSPDVRLQGGESSSITVSTMWIYLAIGIQRLDDDDQGELEGGRNWLKHKTAVFVLKRAKS